MKQKVIIKISSMNDARTRRKALEIAVSVPGVISIELQGDKIAIIGEGIDSTCLTVKLRKKVGYTELVSVNPVDPEKKPVEKKPEPVQPIICKPPFQYETPHICWTAVRDPYPDPCTIM